jgi:hypothetical protein
LLPGGLAILKVPGGHQQNFMPKPLVISSPACDPEIEPTMFEVVFCSSFNFSVFELGRCGLAGHGSKPRTKTLTNSRVLERFMPFSSIEKEAGPNRVSWPPRHDRLALRRHRPHSQIETNGTLKIVWNEAIHVQFTRGGRS